MSRASKGLLYFLLVLGVIVVLAILILLTQSERIAFKIGEYTTARVGTERQIEIAIGDIGGNFIRDVSISDICITYTGSPTPHVLLSIPKIYIRFDLISAVRRKVSIDSIHIESPRVSIPLDEDGSRIFPLGKSVKEVAERKPYRPLAVDIKKLVLDGGTVLIEGKKPVMLKEILMAGKIRSVQGKTQVILDTLSLQQEGGIQLNDAKGNLLITENGFEIDGLRIATEKSTLGVSGLIGEEKDRQIRMDLTLDPLDLGEVGLIIGNEDLSGSIAGEFKIRGRMGDLEIAVAANGGYKGFQFEDLMGSILWNKKKVELKDLGLVLNGAPMLVSATYRFEKVPSYTGSVSFERLDIAKFVNNDKRYQSNLNGSVEFQGRGITQKDFKLLTRPRLRKGSYSDWRFDEVEGEVTFDANSVNLRKVNARIGDARATASGVIMYEGRTQIDFVFDAQDLKSLEKDYPIAGLGGKIHAEGKVEYSDGTTRITTEAEGEDIQYKGVGIGGVNLGLWLEKSAKWKGSFKAFGASLGIPGFPAKDFLIDLTVDEPRIEINKVTLTREDGSRLGLFGSGEFRGKGFDLSIENLFADINGYFWQNLQPVLISFDQGSIKMDKLEIGSKLGAISVEHLFYSKGEFKCRVAARDFNLELLGAMLKKNLIGGVLGFDIQIEGSQDKLEFTSSLRIDKPVLQSVAFDLLSAEFNYKEGILNLTDLSLLGERGKAQVTGRMPVDLSPSNISRHSKQKRLSKVFSNIGRFELKAQQIDGSLLGLAVPALKELKGLAEINVVISGNTMSPRIVSEGRMAQAAYGNTQLGEMSWSLIYEDSLLQIVDATVTDGKGSVKVGGVLPIVICFDPMEAKVLDENINISVNAENGNIGLLCELIPTLKVCSGSYSADLRIAGKPKDILFYGFIKVENGEFRVKGVAQGVKNVFASTRAEGKIFYIDEFVAEKGAIRGSGHIAINGSRTSELEIRVDLKDYYVGEYEDFVAKVEGQIVITGEAIENGKVIPKIEGNLTVKTGEYYYAAPSAGGGGEFMAPTVSPSWLMNIQVEIPKDFWVRGGDIEAELQGDLRVKRTNEGLVLLGTMKTLRGRFFVYHNAFRISKGEFRFSDVKSLSKAYIDVEAESRVLDEMIKIRANGSLDNLSITATSESGWSETQIFEALTLRRGVSPEEPTRSGFFSDALLRSWAMVLANQVSEEVARELRLDRFGIEFGDVGEGDAFSSARLTLGKYVSSNIYLEYSQALGSLYGVERKVTQRRLAYPERQLSVEYRLSNRLSVEGETGTIGGLNYFEVDLKLRLEY